MIFRLQMDLFSVILLKIVEQIGGDIECGLGHVKSGVHLQFTVVFLEGERGGAVAFAVCGFEVALSVK